MRGRLPEAIVARRDKPGSAAPQQAWLADGRTQVAALLRGGQLTQRGWVAPPEIERVLDKGLLGGRATEQLWRLFITEAWLRMLWPHAGGGAGRETWDAGLAAEARRPRATAPGTAPEARGSTTGQGLAGRP